MSNYEVPNAKTAAHLKRSKKQIEAGDYHHFDNNKQALDFLKDLIQYTTRE